ncbi:MAG: CGGC domain-containing protein [Clostridia bacterium]|nr:CGGC domain-containing protein [Clostridia bacterium]
MKAGLIRCLKTESMCPASICLQVMRTRQSAFAGTEEDIELVGVSTCGGCPGDKAAARAAEMVRRGADTIVLASCITNTRPVETACRNSARMVEAIRQAVGDTIRIIGRTH